MRRLNSDLSEVVMSLFISPEAGQFCSCIDGVAIGRQLNAEEGANQLFRLTFKIYFNTHIQVSVNG